MCHRRTYREKRRNGKNTNRFLNKASYKKNYHFFIDLLLQVQKYKNCEMFCEYLKMESRYLFLMHLHDFEIATVSSLARTNSINCP